MSFLSSIFCVNCNDFYDDTRKPCTGTCNHSICLHCQTRLSPSDCPICDKEEAFSKPVINYEGLKIQQLMKNELTEQSIREFVSNQMKKDSGPCGECGDHSEKLRICVDCGQKSGLVKRTFDGYLTNVNGTTILGAFLKAKSISICSTCASDGEHAEHRIEHFLKIISEKLVDVEIYTILGRLMDRVYAKEAERSSSQCQRILSACKRNAWLMELERQREREALPSKRSMMRMKWRLAMAHRDVFQLMSTKLQDSEEAIEDPEAFGKFQEEMEEVLGRTIREDETLSSKELEEINDKVKERIRKYTENPEENVFLDQRKAIDRVKGCRDRVYKQLETINSVKFALVHLMRGDGVTDIQKTVEELRNEHIEHDRLTTSLFQAVEEHSLCQVVYIESVKMRWDVNGGDDDPSGYVGKFIEDQKKYELEEEILGGGVLSYF